MLSISHVGLHYLPPPHISPDAAQAAPGGRAAERKRRSGGRELSPGKTIKERRIKRGGKSDRQGSNNRREGKGGGAGGRQPGAAALASADDAVVVAVTTRPVGPQSRDGPPLQASWEAEAERSDLRDEADAWD